MTYPKFTEEAIKMAHKVNREELIEILDENIKRARTYNYPNDFFIRQAIEEKEKKIKQYDNGENVIWHTNYDHEGYGTWGEDFITDLYTDGTYKVTSHLAD